MVTSLISLLILIGVYFALYRITARGEIIPVGSVRKQLEKFIWQSHLRISHLTKVKFTDDSDDCDTYKLDLEYDSEYAYSHIQKVLPDIINNIKLLLSYHFGKTMYIYDIMFIPSLGDLVTLKIQYEIK